MNTTDCMLQACTHARIGPNVDVFAYDLIFFDIFRTLVKGDNENRRPPVGVAGGDYPALDGRRGARGGPAGAGGSCGGAPRGPRAIVPWIRSISPPLPGIRTGTRQSCPAAARRSRCCIDSPPAPGIQYPHPHRYPAFTAARRSISWPNRKYSPPPPGIRLLPGVRYLP